MKKIKKSSELLWLMGTVFVALGVAICNKADLGVSMLAAPAFVIYEAIAPIWSGFSVGMMEYIIQGIELLVLCIVICKFKWRYLLSFLFAVIYGYTLNLFIFILNGLVLDAVWLRWLMLLLGDTLTAFGVACFFKTYLPLGVCELFVKEFSLELKLNINKVKLYFDAILFGISVVLAFVLFSDASTFDWSTIGYRSFHSIGLGTIVTTVINSPLIALMGKLVDKIFEPTPLFSKIEKILKK